MSMFENIWRKLASSKSYREEFALSLLKRSVPFQVRTIRKKRSLSQSELAQQANLTQGVISRAEDPDYGNLTLNTIGRIAAGFDLAFVGRFVSFSELARFSNELSEAQFQQILTFEQENQAFERGVLSEKAAPPKKPVESVPANPEDPRELASRGNIVDITVGRQNEQKNDKFREEMKGRVPA